MKKRFLFLFLITGLVLMNACQKELSSESGNTPSEGTLQDDGAGDCLPKTVSGAYVVGTALVGTTNYIEVQVNVTTVGSYTIYTDTVNGMYFRISGAFTATGLATVRLKGNGTPGATGISNFIVTYGTSGCTIAVTVVGSLAVFTLDGAPGGCMGAAVAGTYTAGTALNASNNVTINVNVTTAGAYNLTSTLSNGMTFTGSGVFATTGAQAIVLTGSGIPASTGATSIPVTAGSSSCSFPVNVGGAAGAAVFTVNCPSAVVNGTYTVNTALGAANTVTITVDVATAGTYSITGTINGMTFSSAPGASFASAGAGQTVTLTGSGTPTTQGANSVPLTGGTAPCNFNVTVNPAAGGAATFAVNCASAIINGTYTQNTALVASNTVVLSINVTIVGTYNITTTAANGMTFSSGPGTFAATGVQNVTLNGSGTPTASGPTTIPVPAGTAPCNFIINVNPAAGGAAVFAVNCASAVVNGAYVINTALAGTNTVTISVNVATAGTYTITTTATNGMTFSATGTFAATGVQSVTLNGSGIPTASGPFTIPVPSGTAPCTFPLTVYRGTWSFTEGANNFSGFIDDAEWDLTSAAPFLLLYFSGPTVAGHYFEIDLLDVSTTIAANETYNAAVFTGAANSGLLYFEGPPPASPVLYQADPFAAIPNTMILRVTSHNVGTKTVVGTFSGNVLDGSNNPKTISAGNFTVVYP